MHELDKHAAKQNLPLLFENILKGKSCGLISEAGNPCIADPGAELVSFAHQNSIKVIPLVGPSSILLALIASGFNGQQFCFTGYLPIHGTERTKKIRTLENAARHTTQLFMETPFRNQKLFEDVLNTCAPETRLCIACDLTLPTQFIQTKTIADWKLSAPDINKRYCIFLLG